MITPVQRARRGIGACLAAVVSACSAAPEQDILGSFFPAWLLCAAIGTLATIVIRQVMMAARVNEFVVASLLTYLALDMSVTLLVWLVWFGG